MLLDTNFSSQLSTWSRSTETFFTTAKIIIFFYQITSPMDNSILGERCCLSTSCQTVLLCMYYIVSLQKISSITLFSDFFKFHPNMPNFAEANTLSPKYLSLNSHKSPKPNEWMNTWEELIVWQTLTSSRDHLPISPYYTYMVIL